MKDFWNQEEEDMLVGGEQKQLVGGDGVDEEDGVEELEW